MIEYGLEWHSLDSYFQFKEQSSAPGTPESGHLRVYAKDKSGTSALYLKDDAGNEREIGPANTVTGTGTANRLAYWSSSSVLAAVGALTQNRLVTADANGLPTSVAALTQGRVMFPDSNGLPTGSASLFWDHSNSRLGLGTASPGFQFHGVAADSSSFNFTLDTFGTATTPNYRGRSARNTAASPQALQADDFLLSLSGLGYHSSSDYSSGARAQINFKAAEGWTNAAQGSYITLETTPTGSTTRAERLRIEASGDISHASDVRHRMLSQNRFRYLNSTASVYNSTTQSVANATDTAITYDTELFDTDGLHSTLSSTSRITAALAGKYLLTANIEWAANATGVRQFQFRKNGTTALAVTRIPNTGGAVTDFNSLAAIASLAAGDYVEVVAFQTSGGDLNVNGAIYNTFSMAYVGE